ncbi:MAG: enoyl-CoA hydratase/isomerase family protein [Bacteroidetes bacterium]|nr:enoyl-CoA hydratase/isomerase family protein [Bacteroidota bacterium]
MSQVTGKVDSRTENGIATISFFHPQSNSLPGTVLTDLAGEINRAGENPEVRVIILKSEGEKTFCAGASFDELISIDTIEKGKIFFSGFASVINAIRKAPKFVIARVQGKAVGGGVGLASAADYTLALDTASIKLSELAIGIGPFVVGPAVERKIGKPAFTQLSINATEWQSAQWAKEKGLYADVFSSIDELDKAIKLLTGRLAQSNPEAMALLKKTFWKGTEDWDTLLIERAEMSGRLVLSDFTRNAIAKFKAGKS